MLLFIMRFRVRGFVPRTVGELAGCWHVCLEYRCPLGMGVWRLVGVEAETLAVAAVRLRVISTVRV